MRLFIATPFPKKFKSKIFNLTRDLREDFPRLSWVKECNLHLTIKFLGNVKEDLLPQLKQTIKNIAKENQDFDLTFDRLGIFEKHYVVVWVGIILSKQLLHLVDTTERKIAKFEVRPEKRTYFPHITLGRGKRLSKETVENMKNQIEEINLNRMTYRVSELILMQSELSSRGAKYSPIYKSSLKPDIFLHQVV